ncbi:MAG TPA: hypothetical protein VLT59_08275 [Steroidobacteraceae bacterium]|nr:hypothetical protein [Steroidobacteraceae bacterium]
MHVFIVCCRQSQRAPEDVLTATSTFDDAGDVVKDLIEHRAVQLPRTETYPIYRVEFGQPAEFIGQYTLLPNDYVFMPRSALRTFDEPTTFDMFKVEATATFSG